jgi:hypothetical protein
MYTSHVKIPERVMQCGELKESTSCVSFFCVGRATLQTDRCDGPDGSQVRCVGDLRQAPCSLPDGSKNVLYYSPAPHNV